MLHGTYPLHPVIWPIRILKVQQDPIEGPGEGQVHGGIMGCVTLQRHILPLIDVSIGRCQCDLSGICKVWAKKRASGRAVNCLDSMGA